jgi:methyl-accepting chemotaxis protein WspA
MRNLKIWQKLAAMSAVLSQLSDAARQTVESLHQSNAVIDGLNQAATQMRNGVSRFALAA